MGRSSQQLKKNISGLFSRIKLKVFGSFNYSKFVIVTRSRTGSNFLISLLNSHPNIEANGEVFNLLKGRNCKKVWNELFSKKPKVIKHVGFKIFYYHPNDCDDKKVWDLLESDRSIKIIHLRRENKLRTHVSRLIAGKSDVWKSYNNEISAKDKGVEVNTEKLLNDFYTSEFFEVETRKKFSDHPFLEITYESLVKDQTLTHQKILQFLEVSCLSLGSSLRKQNSESLRYLIKNYEVVNACLSKTKYANFLDEE